MWLSYMIIVLWYNIFDTCSSDFCCSTAWFCAKSSSLIFFSASICCWYSCWSSADIRRNMCCCRNRISSVFCFFPSSQSYLRCNAVARASEMAQRSFQDKVSNSSCDHFASNLLYLGMKTSSRLLRAGDHCHPVRTKHNAQ